MAKKKKSVAAAVAAAMQKKTGRTKLLVDGVSSDVTKTIPTGLKALDHYGLGIGGWPVGRIVELYGTPGVGKTSLLLKAFAEAQKLGYVTYLIEVEARFSRARAVTMGVNIDELLLDEPEHWGEVMEDFEAFLTSLPDDQPALIGLDSIASTPSVEEFKGGIGTQAKRDVRAKDLSQFLRRVTVPLRRKQACFIAVNQIRDNVGQQYGPSHTTPGGHALKFHATARIHLKGGLAVTDTGNTRVGIDPYIEVEKNSLSMPFRKFRARLMFETGWDEEWTTLNLAKELKLIGPRKRKYEDALAALIESGIYKGV